MKTLKHALVCWALFAGWAATACAEDSPRSLPEAVGLSSAKLERIRSVVQAMVDKNEVAGAVTVVARRGKVVHWETFGKMDIDSGKAMQPDTIFRIYSMSKPITTVAALLLWEEGRFQLDDPVSKFLPEFAGLRVHTGTGNDTVEAKREATVRDLMRHTSGLTYGLFSDTPVDRLYRQRLVLSDPKDSLSDLMAKLGKLPLLNQPGTRFQYSVSTDVLGRLVEVVSGTPLDAFFQERIFKPLDMKDTGFFVPEGKIARFAANYGPAEKGGLKVIDAPAQSRFRNRPRLLSGGGGLVSTARDYLRFCQMLVNGGELQGTRLLRAETVQQMASNQLPAEAMPLSLVMPRPGLGFGLGFSVRVAKSILDPAAIPGEYGWGGAASTHFWISPRHGLIVLALQQFMPYTSRLEASLKPIVYDSITD
jgi:CubicO group peptidase (beta-lactamase class C family)